MTQASLNKPLSERAVTSPSTDQVTWLPSALRSLSLQRCFPSQYASLRKTASEQGFPPGGNGLFPGGLADVEAGRRQAHCLVGESPSKTGSGSSRQTFCSEGFTGGSPGWWRFSANVTSVDDANAPGDLCWRLEGREMG